LSTGTTTGIDYGTIAYDTATGARLWTRRYNGPGNGFDGPLGLACSPDGATAIVTGQSLGATSTDFATVAYSIT
jgi:hypothetical protein